MLSEALKWRQIRSAQEAAAMAGLKALPPDFEFRQLSS